MPLSNMSHKPQSYPGAKGASGTTQQLRNLLPPHRRYFEFFAGSATLFRHKAPAALSVLIERSPAQARSLEALVAGCNDAVVIEADAFELLLRWTFQAGDLLYLDPPYLHETRSKRLLYGDFELTEDQHCRLLEILASIKTPWLLSGYRSRLYDAHAAACGWRRVDWPAMTRGGPRTESAWLNFAPTSSLAEYSVLGSTYRDRERIKRKIARWTRRLASLDPLERIALEKAMLDRASPPTT